MDRISQQIDDLCDRFEAQRRQDDSVRIEDFLHEVAPEHRATLIRELLEIEIELASQAPGDSETPASDQPVIRLQESLRRRFPEQKEQIDSMVRRVVRLRQIGDYEIIRELGHGGMGIVYKARQKLLNQTVAIKVLSQTLLGDPQAVGRFRREMQLIGGLNHPNIVRALNAGEVDGLHYLVMEFIDGMTLQQLCDKRRRGDRSFSDQPSDGSFSGNEKGFSKASRNQEPTALHLSSLGDVMRPGAISVGGTFYPSSPSIVSSATVDVPAADFPIGAACEAIRQAALGLQHAHEFGLVHRDIKPANLMLDRYGIVKVLDLGLGKFLDEHRQPNEGTSLTMAGTTIGTVDYISPEQCENAGDVDIRADLYSLGCTFYFLLTGKAPYSGSRYDTTRKKLMAHIVGEIPNLKKIRSDIPEGLEAVFGKMLAKEPAERFQVPFDVAEALAPFASAEELREMCGGELPAEPHRRPGSTSRISGTSQTRQIKASQKSRPWFVPSLIPGGAKDVLGALLFIPLVGLVIALLLPGIVALRNHWARARQSVPAPLVAPVGNEAAANSVPSMEKEPMQVELAQLPGLNGSWWFYETPWYLPFIREKLLRKLDESDNPRDVLGDDPEKYFDPNISAVHAWLWKVVQVCRDELRPCERDLLDGLKKYYDTSTTTADTERSFQELLERFTAVHAVKNGTGPNVRTGEKPESACSSKAVLLHTQALLEHRLATVRNDRELAVTAAGRYNEALDRYRAETTALENEGGAAASQARHLRRLELLCLSDSARLEYLATGSYGKAIQRFESVMQQRKTGERLSALFVAEFRSAYGTLCAESGRFDDSQFVRGRDILSRSRIGERMHPLSAQLTERYAWSLLDQWKVVEAERQFQEALVLRAANYKETGNRQAADYLFHDMHGYALTLRYRGNVARAVEEYRRTLADIDKLLEECRSMPPETQHQADGRTVTMSSGIGRFHASLRDRAANTRERLADCVLYEGAACGAFGMGRLEETANLYKEAAEFYDNEGPARAMRVKQTIILILQNKIDEAEQILRKMDQEKRSLLGNQLRTELLRQVADALLAYQKAERIQAGQAANDGDSSRNGDPNDPVPDAGRKQLLRQFLTQFSIAGNPVSADASRRETLELRIFCAEFLVAEAVEQKDFKSLASDLSRLMQPIGDFTNRPESKPFLRRIGDRIVCSNALLYEHFPDSPSSQGQLFSIVRLLKMLRAQPLDDAADGMIASSADLLPTYVVFFLTSHPADGFVVFYPMDGRPGTFHRLPLTRQEVKAGGRRQGSQWKLDPRLLRSTREEREAGRTVNISWSDDACWGRADDALHDSDWPFEELKLNP